MKPNPPKFPHIGSHEFAGTVVALLDTPSDIAKKYPPGTRLGVPGRGYNVCGSCFECKDPSTDYVGYGYRCPNASSNGLSKDGGFGEFVVVDARQVAALPDGMDAVTAAPLMCAGVTIYNALKKCNLSPGQWVAIVGAGGGLGNLGLQFASAMELNTVGVDAADGPLKLAKSLGAKATIVDVRSTPAEEVVLKLGAQDQKLDRADMGVDAAIILPESQAGYDYGVKLLRNHGICVVVSFPEDGFRVSARDLVFRDISVVGTMLASSPGCGLCVEHVLSCSTCYKTQADLYLEQGTRESLQEMVAFAAKHNIKAITKTYSLEKLNDLVDEYNKGDGGKLVVDMSL